MYKVRYPDAGREGYIWEINSASLRRIPLAYHIDPPWNTE